MYFFFLAMIAILYPKILSIHILLNYAIFVNTSGFTHCQNSIKTLLYAIVKITLAGIVGRNYPSVGLQGTHLLHLIETTIKGSILLFSS